MHNSKKELIKSKNEEKRNINYTKNNYSIISNENVIDLQTYNSFFIEKTNLKSFLNIQEILNSNDNKEIENPSNVLTYKKEILKNEKLKEVVSKNIILKFNFNE